LSKVTKCGIEECMHNNAMECHADGIEVKSSTMDRKVNMSENTCCDTFKPKK